MKPTAAGEADQSQPALRALAAPRHRPHPDRVNGRVRAVDITTPSSGDQRPLVPLPSGSTTPPNSHPGWTEERGPVTGSPVGVELLIVGALIAAGTLARLFLGAPRIVVAQSPDGPGVALAWRVSDWRGPHAYRQPWNYSSSGGDRSGSRGGYRAGAEARGAHPPPRPPGLIRPGAACAFASASSPLGLRAHRFCFGSRRDRSSSADVSDDSRSCDRCFVKGGLADHLPEPQDARPRGLVFAKCERAHTLGQTPALIRRKHLGVRS